MPSFIVAHADTIVASTSAFFIVAASFTAIDDLRSAPFGKEDAQFTRRRLVIFAAWIALLLVVTGVYIVASGHASPRMGALFCFTNLYSLLMFTVRDGLKRKTRKGYAYAGACILILAVAACLMVLAPPPK